MTRGAAADTGAAPDSRRIRSGCMIKTRQQRARFVDDLTAVPRPDANGVSGRPPRRPDRAGHRWRPACLRSRMIVSTRPGRFSPSRSRCSERASSFSAAERGRQWRDAFRCRAAWSRSARPWKRRRRASFFEEVGVEAEIIAFNRHIEPILREGDRVRAHFVIASFVARWTRGEARVSKEMDAVGWIEPAKPAHPSLRRPRLAEILESAWRIERERR